MLRVSLRISPMTMNKSQQASFANFLAELPGVVESQNRVDSSVKKIVHRPINSPLNGDHYVEIDFPHDHPILKTVFDLFGPN